MTTRWLDSFDHISSALMSRKYNTATNANISANGRNGTNSLSFNNSGATRILEKIFDNQNKWIIGFAISLNQQSFSGPLVDVRDGTTVQDLVRLESDYTLSVVHGDGTIHTTVITVNLSQYYYLEWEITVNGTSGSSDLWLDGAKVLSSAGDTTATVNNYANRVRLTGNGKYYADDLYILDGTGSSNNSRWGDIRVAAVFPVGDGTYTQWTPSTGTSHHVLVDESTPDTTDYISANTGSGLMDSFTSGSLPVAGYNIKSIQHVFYDRSTVASDRIKSFVRSSGSNYFSSDIAPSDTTDYFHTFMWETDPADGTWTDITFNAAEFGVQSV